MPSRPRLLTTESSVRYLLRDGPRPPAIAGKGRADWEQWQRETRNRLRTCLGLLPGLELPLPNADSSTAAWTRADWNLELGPSEEVDGCVRRHVLFDPDPFSTIAAWLLEPADMERGGRRPAILAAHGHGKGKDVLAGIGD